MSATKKNALDDLRVDTANLYREETFTDLAVATIRRLTPVKADGSVDNARECIYTAQTHVMTPAGAIPVQCELEAGNLSEAIEKFPAAIKQSVESMISEIEDLRRQQASRIVVPQPGQIPPGGPGGAPGKGSGLIQLG